MKKFTDIFVAVHGIGKQSRFATVRSVATQLADSKTLRGGYQGWPVAPQPLGYFHSDVRSMTSVCLLDDADILEKSELATIGFAEVFWADIPQEVVKEGRTLEETKAWARTVVARANALCARAKAAGDARIKLAEDALEQAKSAAAEVSRIKMASDDRDKVTEDYSILPPDFTLAGEVLDEIIETVYVLENLLLVAGRAGLFKFNLREVLEEYLGDVQLVAEFSYYRTDIVGRFHRAMESIYQQQCDLGNPDVRIHIVAHSEGTVVSFLGLLHAMSGHRLSPADPARNVDAKMDPASIPEWLKHIYGYLTIGSPIDKHLLLWPRLWEGLQPKLANDVFGRDRIRWRNYYDYGDPIGFKLDSARLWLRHIKCEAFEFCGCPKCHHDIGFARYLFPGEAHNEYWNDPEVFEHFIKDVVKWVPGTNRPQRPKSKFLTLWFSPSFPYAVSFLLLFAGVFVLYKAVHAYTHPSLDPLQKFVRFTQLGITPISEQSGWNVFRAIFGTAGLIAGATLLTRFPRLAMGRPWRPLKQRRLKQLAERFPHLVASPTWTLAGFISFFIGCALYSFVVPHAIRTEMGGSFDYLGPHGPTLGVLGLTAIAGMIGYLVVSRGIGDTDRRQRWLWKGMRPLIVCGALAVTLIVLLQLFPRNPGPHFKVPAAKGVPFTPAQLEVIRDSRLTAHELNDVIIAKGGQWTATLANVNPVLATHPPTWPVLLAGAGFLYLWWLATLIFDLAFVWQRYVRRSTANDRLREWNPYGFSPRGEEDEATCHPTPGNLSAST